MKKQLWYMICLLCISLVFASCKKDEIVIENDEIEDSKPSNAITFYGNVVDEETGLPIPLVSLDFYGNGDYFYYVGGASTITDKDGKYELWITIRYYSSCVIRTEISKSGYKTVKTSQAVSDQMEGTKIQKSFALVKE